VLVFQDLFFFNLRDSFLMCEGDKGRENLPRLTHGHRSKSRVHKQPQTVKHPTVQFVEKRSLWNLNSPGSPLNFTTCSGGKATTIDGWMVLAHAAHQLWRLEYSPRPTPTGLQSRKRITTSFFWMLSSSCQHAQLLPFLFYIKKNSNLDTGTKSVCMQTSSLTKKHIEKFAHQSHP
jgi:hypothetical protein